MGRKLLKTVQTITTFRNHLAAPVGTRRGPPSVRGPQFENRCYSSCFVFTKHPVQLKTVTTHTHTRLTALFPGPPGWAGTRKVKPIWISLKQETMSGSGISWTICKSAPCSRQITTPVPHHSVFFTGRMPFLPPNQQCQSTHMFSKYVLSKKEHLNKRAGVWTLWTPRLDPPLIIVTVSND